MKKILKLIDKLYFRIRRHINPPNGEKEYSKGFANGYNAGRAAVLLKLQEKSLYNFRSQELRLGYDYAIWSAKKVEEK
jgi:hypothetical protein